VFSVIVGAWPSWAASATIDVRCSWMSGDAKRVAQGVRARGAESRAHRRSEVAVAPVVPVVAHPPSAVLADEEHVRRAAPALGDPRRDVLGERFEEVHRSVRPVRLLSLQVTRR